MCTGAPAPGLGLAGGWKDVGPQPKPSPAVRLAGESLSALPSVCVQAIPIPRCLNSAHAHYMDLLRCPGLRPLAALHAVLGSYPVPPGPKPSRTHTLHAASTAAAPQSPPPPPPSMAPPHSPTSLTGDAMPVRRNYPATLPTAVSWPADGGSSWTRLP